MDADIWSPAVPHAWNAKHNKMSWRMAMVLTDAHIQLLLFFQPFRVLFFKKQSTQLHSRLEQIKISEVLWHS